MSSPKVSIIMPSLNVASYIRECIESAINQTLKEIEIICVDAGSTDGTLEILREYAEKDGRIKVIVSDKKSYGYQMNLGLDTASGEYIGILETDDWVEPNMFEVLWNTARNNNADMVKSNYYWYTTKGGIRNEPFENLVNCTYNHVFSSSDDIRIFTVTPSIWSGIYLREMLVNNRIRFNETPGASFQDTSFHFQVCTTVQRCYLLRDYFLHYRRDNDGSSVHSKSKVFCIADEMNYFEEFLDTNPERKEKLIRMYQALKYEKYRWNIERLAPVDAYSFLKLMHEQFSAAYAEGLLCEEYFSNSAWQKVMQVITNPAGYFREMQLRRLAKSGTGQASAPVLLKESKCEAPEISVIIPFFNVEAYLEECLESVIHQSFTNIEIICIDDGSLDGSRAIVEKYAVVDNRIAIVDMQINGGQSSARNAGIEFSKGKYIYCMDSDDYILPDALEKLYACAEKNRLDILYFGAESFFENEELRKEHQNYIDFYRRIPTYQEPVSGDIFLWDQLQNWLFRCSVPLQLIRRGYLKETGIQFREGIIHEDELFSCVLVAKAKRVLCIEDAYYRRRVRGDSSMTVKYTANKCVGLCIVSTSLFAIAVSDQSLSQTAKMAISYHAQKILRDARITYAKLTSEERKKIMEMLPIEYRFFYTEMVWDQAEPMDIQNSLSFKLGSVITFIPRKIRGFILCAKENGLRHTIRLLFVKLGLLEK